MNFLAELRRRRRRRVFNLRRGSPIHHSYRLVRLTTALVLMHLGIGVK